MAMVLYRCEPYRVYETRRMGAPKRVQRLEHWFKAARQALPKIPDPNLGSWALSVPIISPDYIRWELREKSTDVCAHVIIDRKAPMLG